MENKGGSSSCNIKPDRKTVEKNRRITMKNLRSELMSLIPDKHFKPQKEFLSQKDQIEQVADYIKILEVSVEGLKRRREGIYSYKTDPKLGEPKLPILEIKELGSDVEVVIISGHNKKLKLHKIISIIEQEGAQMVTVNVSTVGDTIFHNLHAKVLVPRIGADTSRIRDKIHELMA